MDMETFNHSEIYLENICTIHQHLYLDTLTEQVQQFRHQVDVKGKMETPTQQFIIEINVDIFEHQGNKLLSSLKVAFMYKIPNFDLFFKIDADKHLQVQSKQLLEWVSFESIATMRGLMVGYFRGTPLHHAYLPLVFQKERN
jgi:hypothetical protein